MSDYQYDIFWKLYNNALDAIILPNNNKPFAIIDGCPGSGKSMLIHEMIIALSLTNQTKEKNIKILVVADGDEELDALAHSLHCVRAKEMQNQEKISFIRYNGIRNRHLNQYNPRLKAQSTEKSIEEKTKIIRNANIIFCRTKYLNQLYTR